MRSRPTTAIASAVAVNPRAASGTGSASPSSATASRIASLPHGSSSPRTPTNATAATPSSRAPSPSITPWTERAEVSGGGGATSIGGRGGSGAMRGRVRGRGGESPGGALGGAPSPVLFAIVTPAVSDLHPSSCRESERRAGSRVD